MVPENSVLGTSSRIKTDAVFHSGSVHDISNIIRALEWFLCRLVDHKLELQAQLADETPSWLGSTYAPEETPPPDVAHMRMVVEVFM